MNIYDIAKEAGVSISTVSRVMNNKGNVNAATRKKVEAILDKHDYTPSAIARGMVSKTMKTAQTVYNHTGYARNYNANCSIILFRGYYFYSREFTIYIFFPPLSSYLNRKQTFMKFSYS